MPKKKKMSIKEMKRFALDKRSVKVAGPAGHRTEYLIECPTCGEARWVANGLYHLFCRPCFLADRWEKWRGGKGDGPWTNIPEYRIWSNMLERCYNPGNDSYPHYGGRGITVCLRWQRSFWDFYEDVGPRPRKGKWVIDRIDNNGNYEPGNIRWATPQQSIHNSRSTKLTWEQVREIRRRSGQTQQAMADEFGVTPGLIGQIVANKIWKEDK